jgi:hypothetical protein
VSATIACEPATVSYTGMLTTAEYGQRLEMMAEPEKHFTPELRTRTLEKLRQVKAPVLLVHGDMHDLRKLNKPIWRRKFFSVKVAGDFPEGGRVCGFRFFGLGEGEVGFASFPGFGDFGEDARDESQQ